MNTEDQLFAAAWESREALKSDEHESDLAKAAQLSADLSAVNGRISVRETVHEANMAALRSFHRSQVETGEAEAADNLEAAALFGDVEETTVDVEQYFRPHFGEPATEFETAKANGAIGD